MARILKGVATNEAKPRMRRSVMCFWALDGRERGTRTRQTHIARRSLIYAKWDMGSVGAIGRTDADGIAQTI